MLKKIIYILLLLPVFILPDKLQFDFDHLQNIDVIINKEIAKKNIPGAVVLVGYGNKIIYLKAFGDRQIYKKKEKMTVDTVFDIASITKPLATAASIWKLVEMGEIRLWDRVSQYVPEFKNYDKENPARIYHLMTHTGGLPPYYDEKLLLNKHKKPELKDLIKEISTLKKDKPGEVFEYSCLGYITLGYIVEKISGEKLSKFAFNNIFSKLEMSSTTFVPDKNLIKRTAPTELVDNILIKGVVHDPLAQSIGGISGNAGVFSTAEDLSKFASMLLNKGYYKDSKIFSPLTVKAYTSIYPLLKKFGRSPGWDVFTDYSSSRGDLFPIASYGHTGFTGTSLWIDPQTKVFVVFLSNRVHPKRGKSTVRLYSIISNIAAASIQK